MKTIAFDLMGNDNGINAGVEAAIAFSSKNLDYNFILVGDKKQINKITQETERIKIIDAPKAVDKAAGARAARKGDTSMAIAINLVKDGMADIVVSSGESGIYLSMLTLTLKRLENVKRPAFLPIMPTIEKGKKFVLLDVGANSESTPEMLSQWAKMGSIFANKVLKIQKPRVGLLNIGTEDSKGLNMHKEADKLIREQNLNYQGFIEARGLFNNITDVAVIDGYAGNMILKTMEGTVISLLSLLKTELKSKTKYKVGALMAKGAFKNVASILDYRNVGSAWVVGLNGLAIKCHGGAGRKSYMSAFSQIDDALKGDVINNFRKAMNE